MNEIVLRPYQKDFINNVRNEFKLNHRHVVGVAPCGAGKTIMTGWMIRETIKNGKRAIFFVHRRELIEQTAATFAQLGIPYGIIASGVKPDYDAPVQIASVQTLVNRLLDVKKPDLLVCDECHHILADSYQRVLAAFPKAFLLGVTATPLRLGGITLNDVFDSMVLSPSVADLIKLGNLTHFNYFTMDITIGDKLLASFLDNATIFQGDYQSENLSRFMLNPSVTKAIIDSYKLYANGKSAICYCVNVKHSQHVARFFNYAGIPAVHCDGSTPKKIRANIINDFRQGKFKILCNAELFGEGFDVPNCHAVILARPTKSLTLHVQQSMRSMRPDPSDLNKTAIIIDCVGNFKELGKPDDFRDWSLDPNKPVLHGDAPPHEVCPNCNTPVHYAAQICPNCGYDLTQDTKVFADDAEQIYSSAENKKMAPTQTISVIHAPTSIEHFVSIAEQKGYKKSWAVFQAFKYVKSYNDLLHIAKIMGYKNGWAYHKALDLKIPIQKTVAKIPAIC